ncbi:MAG: hypothetical protein AAGG80_07570, partial [Pseudomonadota bacterium]
QSKTFRLTPPFLYAKIVSIVRNLHIKNAKKLPIEIKYGVNVTAKQLKSMECFLDENNLPYGLLINQNTKAFWLTKRISQLPATYL